MRTNLRVFMPSFRIAIEGIGIGSTPHNVLSRLRILAEYLPLLDSLNWSVLLVFRNGVSSLCAELASRLWMVVVFSILPRGPSAGIKVSISPTPLIDKHLIRAVLDQRDWIRYDIAHVGSGGAGLQVVFCHFDFGYTTLFGCRPRRTIK